MNPRDRVLQMAAEAGFDLVGLAPLGVPEDAAKFEAWIGTGRHGSMAYLERNQARILNPSSEHSRPKTLLMVGLGHSRLAGAHEDGAQVARYAMGRDYHNWMGKALRRLGKRLEAEGLASGSLARVDAVPLMERSYAAQAGLGVRSKATNLLHPRFGPWFFLGELILDLELEPTDTPQNLSCGSCTACLDACPTGALVAPGELDARLCISYQTIENRGMIPHALRETHGSWLFGCDVCSEVCPWGRKAPNLAERFGTHASLETLSLVRLLDPTWKEEAFAATFVGSALSRPKRAGLARNAALVLGNRPTDQGRVALLQALEGDRSPIVREISAWALARAHRQDSGTSEALQRALLREPNAEAALGMHRSLEQPSGPS